MNMLQRKVFLSGEGLTIEGLVDVARMHAPISLADSVRDRVAASRALLDEKLKRQEVIYGVNTGFGGNVKFSIESSELDHHQSNLVKSLSCGTGRPLNVEVVRGSMALRANALSKGVSAVRPIVIDRLVELLNAGITPIVPSFGSVGASGDLIPSAYVARALLGQGTVDQDGQVRPAHEVLQQAGIQPIALKSKEGLGLMNGTTVMTSVAAITLHDTEYLARLCVAAVALSTEVLMAPANAFDEAIQMMKNHPGQIEVARLLRSDLAGSSLVADLETLREKLRQDRESSSGTYELEASIQTPYSLRCAPQGLGPAFDSLSFAREVIEREMNSVNDNPLIDPTTRRVYHTGNFYGGHVARVMDGVKLDLANIANWAHALMAMLMDPRFSNGLAPNLALHPGLNSGFKGMQLSQTSLVVACRQMCAPSSVHTLPTEQYNQDIVSLGLHSALTAMEMSGLVRNSLSILVLALCQAADLRGVGAGEAHLGAATDQLYQRVRAVAPVLDDDRPMDVDIAGVAELIRCKALGLEDRRARAGN